MIRRGLTLVELVVTVAILSIVAAMLVPMLGDDSAGRLGVATILLRDDLEQARFRTVADPQRPLALMIDEDGLGWSLVDPDQPGRPIERDDGTPWSIRSGEGRGAGMAEVEINLEGVSGKLLDFDESGSVRDRTATPRFSLRSGNREQVLEVGAVTGLVRVRTPD